MKVGEIKEINNKGLSFKVQRIDEQSLNPQTGELTLVAVIISDVPDNKCGVKKGMKIGLIN